MPNDIHDNLIRRILHDKGDIMARSAGFSVTIFDIDYAFSFAVWREFRFQTPQQCRLATSARTYNDGKRTGATEKETPSTAFVSLQG